MRPSGKVKAQSSKQLCQINFSKTLMLYLPVWRFRTQEHGEGVARNLFSCLVVRTMDPACARSAVGLSRRSHVCSFGRGAPVLRSWKVAPLRCGSKHLLIRSCSFFFFFWIGDESSAREPLPRGTHIAVMNSQCHTKGERKMRDKCTKF